MIEILSKSTVTVAGQYTRNFDRNLPLTVREVTIETVGSGQTFDLRRRNFPFELSWEIA